MTTTSPPGTISRRTLLRGATGATATFGLAGCSPGGSSGEKRTLTVWHNYTQQPRVDFMRKVADKFEAANQGVTVKIEVVPFPQFPTKWPAAQAAGTLPDVTTILPETAVSMWLAKALNPIDDVLSALGGTAAFKPGLVDKMAKYDGAYLLLPHYVHNRLLIHRKDLLQEAGIALPESPTWDQVLRAAKATSKPPNRYGWMLKLSASDSGGTNLLYMLTRSAGGRLFDETGRAMLDTAEVKRATEYLVEVAKSASGPGQLNYNINDNFSLINADKTVLSEDSPAVIATAYKDAPQVAEKLATTFMPRDSGGPGHLAAAVSVALPRGKNPELAKDFVKFLYADENYVPFLQTIPLFMFPALAKADSPAFYEQPVIKKYEATAKQTLAGIEAGSAVGFEEGPNPYAGPAVASRVVEKALHAILTGGVGIPKALADANRHLQSTFDDVTSRVGRK